jgi:hypoxanthine phosphoribosyltransferase
MTAQVEADFKDEVPVFRGLNGSFMVVSDFMKSYKGACELSFVKWLPMKGLVLPMRLKNS